MPRDVSTGLANDIARVKAGQTPTGEWAEKLRESQDQLMRMLQNIAESDLSDMEKERLLQVGQKSEDKNALFGALDWIDRWSGAAMLRSGFSQIEKIIDPDESPGMDSFVREWQNNVSFSEILSEYPQFSAMLGRGALQNTAAAFGQDLPTLGSAVSKGLGAFGVQVDPDKADSMIGTMTADVVADPLNLATGGGAAVAKFAGQGGVKLSRTLLQSGRAAAELGDMAEAGRLAQLATRVSEVGFGGLSKAERKAAETALREMGELTGRQTLRGGINLRVPGREGLYIPGTASLAQVTSRPLATARGAIRTSRGFQKAATPFATVQREILAQIRSGDQARVGQSMEALAAHSLAEAESSHWFVDGTERLDRLIRGVKKQKIDRVQLSYFLEDMNASEAAELAGRYMAEPKVREIVDGIRDFQRDHWLSRFNQMVGYQAIATLDNYVPTLMSDPFMAKMFARGRGGSEFSPAAFQKRTQFRVGEDYMGIPIVDAATHPRGLTPKQQGEEILRTYFGDEFVGAMYDRDWIKAAKSRMFVARYRLRGELTARYLKERGAAWTVKDANKIFSTPLTDLKGVMARFGFRKSAEQAAVAREAAMRSGVMPKTIGTRLLTDMQAVDEALTNGTPLSTLASRLADTGEVAVGRRAAIDGLVTRRRQISGRVRQIEQRLNNKVGRMTARVKAGGVAADDEQQAAATLAAWSMGIEPDDVTRLYDEWAEVDAELGRMLGEVDLDADDVKKMSSLVDSMLTHEANRLEVVNYSLSLPMADVGPKALDRIKKLRLEKADLEDRLGALRQIRSNMDTADDANRRLARVRDGFDEEQRFNARRKSILENPSMSVAAKREAIRELHKMAPSTAQHGVYGRAIDRLIEIAPDGVLKNVDGDPMVFVAEPVGMATAKLRQGGSAGGKGAMRGAAGRDRTATRLGMRLTVADDVDGAAESGVDALRVNLRMKKPRLIVGDDNPSGVLDAEMLLAAVDAKMIDLAALDNLTGAQQDFVSAVNSVIARNLDALDEGPEGALRFVDDLDETLGRLASADPPNPVAALFVERAAQKVGASGLTPEAATRLRSDVDALQQEVTSALDELEDTFTRAATAAADEAAAVTDAAAGAADAPVRITLSREFWDDHVGRVYVEGVHTDGVIVEPTVVKSTKNSVTIEGSEDAARELLDDLRYYVDEMDSMDLEKADKARLRRAFASVKKQLDAQGGSAGKAAAGKGAKAAKANEGTSSPIDGMADPVIARMVNEVDPYGELGALTQAQVSERLKPLRGNIRALHRKRVSQTFPDEVSSLEAQIAQLEDEAAALLRIEHQDPNKPAIDGFRTGLARGIAYRVQESDDGGDVARMFAQNYLDRAAELRQRADLALRLGAEVLSSIADPNTKPKQLLDLAFSSYKKLIGDSLPRTKAEFVKEYSNDNDGLRNLFLDKYADLRFNAFASEVQGQAKLERIQLADDLAAQYSSAPAAVAEAAPVAVADAARAAATEPVPASGLKSAKDLVADEIDAQVDELISLLPDPKMVKKLQDASRLLGRSMPDDSAMAKIGTLKGAYKPDPDRPILTWGIRVGGGDERVVWTDSYRMILSNEALRPSSKWVLPPARGEAIPYEKFLSKVPERNLLRRVPGLEDGFIPGLTTAERKAALKGLENAEPSKIDLALGEAHRAKIDNEILKPLASNEAFDVGTQYDMTRIVKSVYDGLAEEPPKLGSIIPDAKAIGEMVELVPQRVRLGLGEKPTPDNMFVILRAVDGSFEAAYHARYFADFAPGLRFKAKDNLKALAVVNANDEVVGLLMPIRVTQDVGAYDPTVRAQVVANEINKITNLGDIPREVRDDMFARVEAIKARFDEFKKASDEVAEGAVAAPTAPPPAAPATPPPAAAAAPAAPTPDPAVAAQAQARLDAVKAFRAGRPIDELPDDVRQVLTPVKQQMDRLDNLRSQLSRPGLSPRAAAFDLIDELVSPAVSTMARADGEAYLAALGDGAAFLRGVKWTPEQVAGSYKARLAKLGYDGVEIDDGAVRSLIPLRADQVRPQDSISRVLLQIEEAQLKLRNEIRDGQQELVNLADKGFGFRLERQTMSRQDALAAAQDNLMRLRKIEPSEANVAERMLRTRAHKAFTMAEEVAAEGDELTAGVLRLEGQAAAGNADQLAAGLGDPAGVLMTGKLSEVDGLAERLARFNGMALKQLDKDTMAEEWLVEALTVGSKLTLPGEVKGLLRAIDFATGVFKQYAIMTFGFHIRNLIGGVMNNWLGGVNVESYAVFRKAESVYFEALRETGSIPEAMRAVDKTMGGRVGDAYRSWHKMEASSGMGISGAFSEDVGRAGGTVLSDEARTGGRFSNFRLAMQNDKLPRERLMNPALGLTDNAAVRANAYMGARVERFLRGSMAMDTLWHKGGDVTDAMLRVRKYHFDYQDLSWLESNVFRRVIPFYVWVSRSIPLQIEGLITKPKVALAYYRLKNGIESMSEDEEIVPNYFGREGAIRMPFLDRNGNQVYWFPDMPLNDLSFFDNPVDVFTSSLNPLLKVPLEIGPAGRKFFTGQPFTSELQEMPGVYSKIGLTQALEKFGQVTQSADGKKMADGRLIYSIEQSFPLFARLVRWFPSTDDGKAKAANTYLSNFLGVSLRSNDERSRNSEIRRRVSVLEDEIAKARGLGSNVKSAGVRQISDKTRTVELNADKLKYETDFLLTAANTFDADMLSQLPGIGESTARWIVASREQNGAYESVRDLMQVESLSETGVNDVLLGLADKPESMGLPTKKQIDLNSSSAEDLERMLPGVGASTARKIVEYRSRFGGITNLWDLDEIDGITRKQIEEIRDYLLDDMMRRASDEYRRYLRGGGGKPLEQVVTK